MAGFFDMISSSNYQAAPTVGGYYGNPQYPQTSYTVQNPQNPYAIPSQAPQGTPILDMAIEGGAAAAGAVGGHQLAKKLGANSVWSNVFGVLGGGLGFLGGKQYVDQSNQAKQNEYFTQRMQQGAAASQMLNNLPGGAPLPSGYQQGNYQPVNNGQPQKTIRMTASLPLMSPTSQGVYMDAAGNMTSDPRQANYLVLDANNPSDLAQMFGNAMKPFGLSVFSVDTTNALMRSMPQQNNQDGTPRRFVFNLDSLRNPSRGQGPVAEMGAQLAVFIGQMTNNAVDVPLALAPSGTILLEAKDEYYSSMKPNLMSGRGYQIAGNDPMFTASQLEKALNNVYSYTSTTQPSSVNWGQRNAAWQNNQYPQVPNTVNWNNIR